MRSSAGSRLRFEAIELRRVGLRFQASRDLRQVAEEEAKTGRQPASAKTANSTAYLPWPFHTVLNGTLLSKPVGKRNRRVRTGFSARSTPTVRITHAQRLGPSCPRV